jgi:putative DNA primase/helicase
LSPYSRTSKGAHFYFRHPGTEVRNGTHLLGRPIDVRGDGGYVVAPPSIHPGAKTAYEWMAPKGAPWQWSLEELPVFDPQWLDAKSPRALLIASMPDANIERARRYIGKIVAISGQGGHDATFRAACQLADRGFAEQQMLQLMLEWNETNAIPKWTEAEIRHKVRDALNRGALAGFPPIQPQAGRVPLNS